MTRRLVAAVLLIASWVTPAAHAQDRREQSPPCLAMEGSPLADLVGSWNVEWRYRTSPGEFAVSAARAEIRLDLGSCAVTERFSGTLRGVPYHALTVITRPSAGEYARVRVDSEHGTFAQSEGTLVEGALVFHWQRDLGTRILSTRHRFSEVKPSSFLVEFFMSPRAGAPPELVQQASYRRVQNK